MRPNDADLTRHVRAFGPLLPVFTCRDQVVDGKRRLAICEKHRVKITRFELRPSLVKPLLWMLNPERITREEYKHALKPAVAAAHEVWSDPGTVASHWLKEEPRDTYRWGRLRKSLDALLNSAAEGRIELTAERLIEAVRKNL